MKKLSIAIMFLLVSAAVFAQNPQSYTPLTAANLAQAGRLSDTRYAVPTEIVTRDISGKTTYIAQSGNVFLSFEMTAEQVRQLAIIQGDKDMPLVLFSRQGTNANNYRFTVDRLIPLKNVFGVPTGSLPRSFSTQDFYEVLDLYIKSGKTDPDNRVAEKVRAVETEAARVKEAETQRREVESARQASEAQRRQTEQRSAQERQQVLTQSTLHGGYKPCFGTGNPYSEEYTQIAVFGSIFNSNDRDFSVASSMNPTLRSDIRLIKSLAVFNQIGSFPGSSSQSLFCLLFLTKTEQNQYQVDDYILFGDLINKTPRSTYASDYKVDFIDSWIIENRDQ
jgi:hypothetical protein